MNQQGEGLEAAIRRLGEGLWREIRQEVPGVFNPDFWQGKMMAWAMRDPSFRADLFRFVEVLPGLRSRGQISSHLKEYLLKEGRSLPAVLEMALKAASGGITGLVGAEVIKRQIIGMSEGFITGADAASSLPVLKKLHQEGLGFTVDLLGEASLTQEEADAYLARYRDLMEVLARETASWPHDPVLEKGPHGPLPRTNVSIKLSALDGRLDPVDAAGAVARLKDRLLPLFLRARELGIFLNLDLESWHLHDIAYDFFEEMALHPGLRDWPHLGVVVQGYLRDAPRDLDRLLSLAGARKAPLTVRLVKGAYWDYEVALSRQKGHPCPVLIGKGAVDAQFESLSLRLLENHERLSPAFGSHNLRSLAHAVAAAESRGVPREAYEIQMLFGMAEPERKAFRARGHRVRVYAPVGEPLPGMAYLMRRLLENTSNTGFLRLSHHEGADMGTLLRPPAATAPAAPADPANEVPRAQAPSEPSPRRGAAPFENCPLLDFSRREVREDFARAVRDWEKALPLPVPVVIGGKPRATASTLEWKSPNDLRPVARQSLAGAAEAEAAVAEAGKGFAAWNARPLEERAALLERLGDLLEARRLSLAALQAYEVGKPWAEADADVAEAVDFCRYYALRARLELAPEEVISPAGEANFMGYQGRGPTVVIAPWNFPLAILCGMATAALAAGNPVILKPAEQSPATAYLLFQAMREAGFPPEAVQFLPARGEEAGPVLVDHPGVAQIAFTGSFAVGTQILRRAAVMQPGQRQLKRVVCEMGGKNAVIVDEDADLDEAVAGVAKSAFGFAGQKCSAASRVIVVGDIYGDFLRRFLGHCRLWRVGSALRPDCDVPPVIDDDALERVRALAKNPGPGAKLLYAGEAPSGGRFVGPLVFEVPGPDHRLMQEEFFAPVIAAARAASFEQALEWALATPYALTGALYSRSPGRIEEARRRFRVGNLYINRPCTGAVVGRQPFGGFGHSGLGSKAGGPGYLRLFADPYSVTENTMRHGFTPEMEG